MSKKKILTIGLDLATDDAVSMNFVGNPSLLDWDIILFKPEIDEFLQYSDNYQGKPSLNESKSFKLKECCEHWRREIKQAVETGKTVLVFLPKPQEIYVDTGARTYSGTGKNQKTTIRVAPYSNYDSIPVDLTRVPATGTSMKLSTREAEILSPYWAEFGELSTYHTILTDIKIPACITTRTGDKPVGAIYRSKISSGALILLPDIDFYPDDFFDENDDWTPKAIQFAGKMISAVTSIDKTLRSSTEITPEPAWAKNPLFELKPESKLKIQLLEAEEQLEKAQKNKEEITEALRAAGSYRALLFEKGKPLEAAIIEALRLFGFRAEPFQDSESEFDVVFECNEGRLIGEAEGKDNKPVNIEKLRQLAMNVHEDLQREDISAPAKPVLFGNGLRLSPPHERIDPFTAKCHSAATTSSTALVFTPDLFPPVQYLTSNSDDTYARHCREAILLGTGRVVFPSPPIQDLLPEKEITSD